MTATLERTRVLTDPAEQVSAQEVERAVQTILAVEDLDERQIIANRIQKSLDEDAPLTASKQAEVDAAWRAEFRRRIADIESGKVKLESFDDAMKRARAELQTRRERRGVFL